MKRFLAAFVLTLALCSCTVPNLALGSPAPLAATAIDDKALSAAWKSFDVALDAINLLIDANQIKVGSPKALAIATGIDRVTAALTAAEHAAAAGSTTSYLSALADVQGAITDLRVALALKG